MLSSLDVVHSSSWSTVLYFAGCPSCSKVLREGDDLKSALQMQNSLVLEVSLVVMLFSHDPFILFLYEFSSNHAAYINSVKGCSIDY